MLSSRPLLRLLEAIGGEETLDDELEEESESLGFPLRLPEFLWLAADATEGRDDEEEEEEEEEAAVAPKQEGREDDEEKEAGGLCCWCCEAEGGSEDEERLPVVLE